MQNNMTNSAVVFILLTDATQTFFLSKMFATIYRAKLRKNRKIHTDNAGLSHHGNAGKSG